VLGGRGWGRDLSFDGILIFGEGRGTFLLMGF